MSNDKIKMYLIIIVFTALIIGTIFYFTVMDRNNDEPDPSLKVDVERKPKGWLVTIKNGSTDHNSSDIWIQDEKENINLKNCSAVKSISNESNPWPPNFVLNDTNRNDKIDKYDTIFIIDSKHIFEGYRLRITGVMIMDGGLY